MSFYDVFDRIMKATGARTQTELAKLLGIRQATVSEAKKRGTIPAEWIMKLYRSHGLSPVWMVDGVGPVYSKPPKGKNHDLEGMAPPFLHEEDAAYGHADAKGPVVTVYSAAGEKKDDGTWEPEPLGQISIPPAFFRPSLMVFRVDGKCMEPIIQRGAYVGIDKGVNRLTSGEIYGVVLPVEGLVVRRVYIDGQNKVYILRPEDEMCPDQELPMNENETQVLGRAVWVMQNL